MVQGERFPVWLVGRIVVEYALWDISNAHVTFRSCHNAGTTLYDACETNEVELGPANVCGPPQVVHSELWTEPVFGEGPTSGYDHVVLTGPGVDTADPPTHAEKRMLEDYWDFDEIFPESRLASMVKLTKDMDGMIIYVPHRLDDSNP